MANQQSSAGQRLTQIKDFLTMNKTATTIPFDPNSTRFPTRNELPTIEGAPKDAAWVWGENDFIGRLNLLTPARVAAASREIQTGEIVPVNLPLDVPEVPAFHRQQFKHEIKTLTENVAYDDVYSLNTQSGTQWDGFRHFSWLETGTFYNNTKGTDIVTPSGTSASHKCSIHHWAEHGIAGRGVLLDYRGYATKKGIAYDPYDHYPISFEELYQCGKDQGIDIRPAAQGGDIKIGDMLFIRSGWTEAYNAKSPDERNALAVRPHEFGINDGQRWAGLSQEERMIDWLHDCYFATAGGDAPAFEAWPSHEAHYLHEYLLALWGMPIAEMLDLEKLAQKCREHNKWFFFFSSAPANCRGGVSSHVNGQAIL
ncbi:cyclase protein [Diplodia corticola]|uniref:Cyclase protein n=1 Tax=Diplodia corticola TaxID=236234 RepID=A0A1J9QRA6_9PEZI|nr:cyclase protein [Diplodia corticola]OJD31478.1 cyclase protein [Diplodia corticola]